MTGPIEVELPRNRSCTALARRLVEQHCARSLHREKLEDLKLVVSELVDNAYVHGDGRIRFSLQRQGDRVRVEVLDEGENASIGIRGLGLRGGGHGLRLVDHLCVAWGSYEGSTHVWAELEAEVVN